MQAGKIASRAGRLGPQLAGFRAAGWGMDTLLAPEEAEPWRGPERRAVAGL